MRFLEDVFVWTVVDQISKSGFWNQEKEKLLIIESGEKSRYDIFPSFIPITIKNHDDKRQCHEASLDKIDCNLGQSRKFIGFWL